MKTKIFLPLLFVISLSLLSYAQTKDYSKYEGYVDFGDLAKFEDSEEVTEVLIEEHLLRMVSKLSKEKDEELEKLLSGLKLVKANVIKVTEDNQEELRDRVETVAKSLYGKGWDRIVKTKSKDELVYVYIKTRNEEDILGLVVTAFEKKGEAAFVNIVGNINLETIGKLTDKFDIPALNNVHSDKKHGKKDEKK